MSPVQPVVNISVPVCHDGRHYNGVTIHNGVTYTEVDNCSGGKALEFANTSLVNPPNVNVGAISAAIVEDSACPQYLQLLPA